VTSAPADSFEHFAADRLASETPALTRLWAERLSAVCPSRRHGDILAGDPAHGFSGVLNLIGTTPRGRASG
jgi:hypothetical protein